MHSKFQNFLAKIKHKITSIKIPRQYEESYLDYYFQKSVKQLNYFSIVFYFSQAVFTVIYFYKYFIDKNNIAYLSFFLAFSVVYTLLAFLLVKIINRISIRSEQNQYFLEVSIIAFFIVLSLGQLVNLYFDIQAEMGIYRFLAFVFGVSSIPVIPRKKIEFTLAFMGVASIVVPVILLLNGSVNFSAFSFVAIVACTLTSAIILISGRLTSVERFVEGKSMQETNFRLEEVNKQLSDMNDKLERLSVTDQLTQINNRRAFDDYIERMWNECRRLRKPMTVMMMDIDHFKAFNDFYGHVEGDECLKTVSETIKKHFNRSTDMFARYGGEEFVAVLPFSEGEPALALAEKIRRDIENLKIPNPKSKTVPFVTISIGVACRVPNQISGQIQNHEWIVTLADKALYDAKESGRNRIAANFTDDEDDSYLAVGMPHIKLPGPGEDLEKLQVIVQASMIAVFSIDLVEGSIEFSKEIVAYIGEEKYKFDYYEEFSGYIYADDRPVFEKTMLDLYSYTLDTTSPVLFRLKCGNDAYSWVSLLIRYMYDNSFNVISAVGAISDYSAQMREQEITKLTAQGSANYLFSYDFESKCANINKDFMDDFSIDAPIIENAAEFFHDMIYPPDRKLFLRAYRKLKNQTEQIMECTIRFNHPANGIIWLSLRGMMSRDTKGKPDILAGSLTDVTEHVKVRQTNELIIEGCSDCVYVIDIKKDIGQFSSGIRSMIDMPELCLHDLSKNWLDYVVPEDKKIFADYYNTIIEGAVDRHSVEYRVYGVNGKPIWIACRGKCSYDDNGEPETFAGSILNISAMGQYNTYIEKLSMSDRVTGLPNRAAFYFDMSNHMIASNSAGHVVMLDVDNFKDVNSMYGIPAGDRFLVELSAFLILNLNYKTDIYHLGRDVFVIHYKDTNEDEAVTFAKKIMDLTSTPVTIDDKAIHYTMSVSIVRYYPGDSADDIITNAEITMRNVKNTGKNKLALYHPEFKETFVKRLELETELRECILNGFKNFEPYFQPIYSVKDNRIAGAEVLLRWKNEEGELIPPNIIIPCLQNIDMFMQVESWIFAEAVKQCKIWLNSGADSDFVINVNLSPKQAVKTGLLDEIKEILDKNALECKNIVFEITEESLLVEMNTNMSTLKQLQEYGISLAVDNFGTGYSSLSYLKNLPINKIKMDRSFVADLETNRSSRDFMLSIIQLAHSMDYTICIEGVETEVQKNILTELNADLLQGFYFSRPVDAQEFESKFLTNIFRDIFNLKKKRGRKKDAPKK